MFLQIKEEKCCEDQTLLRAVTCSNGKGVGLGTSPDPVHIDLYGLYIFMHLSMTLRQSAHPLYCGPSTPLVYYLSYFIFSSWSFWHFASLSVTNLHSSWPLASSPTLPWTWPLGLLQNSHSDVWLLSLTRMNFVVFSFVFPGCPEQHTLSWG